MNAMFWAELPSVRCWQIQQLLSSNLKWYVKTFGTLIVAKHTWFGTMPYKSGHAGCICLESRSSLANRSQPTWTRSRRERKISNLHWDWQTHMLTYLEIKFIYTTTKESGTVLMWQVHVRVCYCLIHLNYESTARRSHIRITAARLLGLISRSFFRKVRVRVNWNST